MQHSIIAASAEAIVARIERRKKKASEKRRSREAARSKEQCVAHARAELREFMLSGARLAAPVVEGTPDVSIIISIWNQPQFLLRCLRAALAHRGPQVEFILVDNASADETRELLSRLDGFRIIRNPINTGYVRASNQGARAASGRHFLFLNSDAFVRRGAVARATATLDDPTIGAVGGRLVLPSGVLQEAGCFVRADGTTGGYAAGLPIDAHEASTRRDVDYCSGAFLMTPAALWRRIGGFDEIFSPGYYEESDYCLRLRAMGSRVVFEPGIVVDHYQFGSQAKPGEALRTSERNQRTFQSRHAEVLATRTLVGSV